MAPGAHFMMSWLSAVPFFNNRRERCLITLAGIAPDIDGLGIVADIINHGKTHFYFDYHHYIGHNIFFALFFSLLCAALARTQRFSVWLFSFLILHLHFLCDIAGSRGPDGYQWPVYYLYPVDPTVALTWSGQWELNAWQNYAIIVLLLVTTVFVGAYKKITFLELISPRFDRSIFNLYHKLFAL
jgi:inner membrane protein